MVWDQTCVIARRSAHVFTVNNVKLHIRHAKQTLSRKTELRECSYVHAKSRVFKSNRGGRKDASRQARLPLTLVFSPMADNNDG